VAWRSNPGRAGPANGIGDRPCLARRLHKAKQRKPPARDRDKRAARARPGRAEGASPRLVRR
jgi:hypothetical protein